MAENVFNNNINNIEGNNYNYIDHIKYPVDFPVKNDGSITSNTMPNDIDAMIYYINTLLFSNKKKWEYSPYKIVDTLNGPIEKKKWRETGGVLGNKYYINLGKCKNGKQKKLFINNKKGFDDFKILGIPNNAFGRDGFNGLLPGVAQNIVDINPLEIYKIAAGESKIIECFKNNTNNFNKIFILVITILFIIYLFKLI